MFQSFGSLKNFINSSRRSTESLVFYLHYRVTFLVLLFCCALVSTQQFYGHKIQCLSKPSTGINPEVLNSYCWAASTYSVYSPFSNEAGVRFPHPGVVSSIAGSKHQHQNYYQYVHIILFIQAILFYLPHLVWKAVERNFVTHLASVISTFESEAHPKDLRDSKNMSYLAAYVEYRWGTHKMLVLKYLCCELLSIVNVMVQSYLLNLFFYGRFLGLGLFIDAYYGSAVLSDPIELFPLVTVCMFRRYGPTGRIDVIDSLCVLPNNAINAKIYLCLWVWFLVLLILTFFSVVHLLCCVCIPVYRVLLPKMQSLFPGSVGTHPLTTLLRAGDFGDWFVLGSIRRDMDSLEFSFLMENIRDRLCSDETETKVPIE